jgi:hypothetical protein
VLAGCSSHAGSSAGNGQPAQRVAGQTSFVSAPMLGQSGGAGGATLSAGGAEGAGAPTASPPASNAGSGSATTAAPRTVQETDLYRVEGNRLYYLNSYRGLMVFDVTNPDAPQLLGRSPIFGDPQEMIVQNGVAVVVVGDWYGQDVDGTPFHGSIVRGLDATDPTNIKTVGEVKLGGWVQDTRVVGNVLYAVIQDYGWEYGWYGGWAGYGYYGGGGGVAVPVSGGVATNSGGTGSNGPKVAIASVSFANGVVTKAGYQAFPNATGGVFNVTPNSIMLASAAADTTGTDSAGHTTLQYVDISDPNGAIKLRGSFVTNGAITGWGPDNGRWNLDFADGATAHALGCADQYCGGVTDSYVLSTVDFSNPDSPKEVSELTIPNLGWSAAARFSNNLLYLSPNGYYGSGNNVQTPFSIYDLSNPAAPKIAGTTQIDGSVWLYIPGGGHLFSVGSTEQTNSNQVSVQYLDVSNPSAPKVVGTSNFGQGWAWTPAASTFKAFTVDDSKGLAVVPFSGWDYNSQTYANGVQLIQYTSTGITGGGAAHTRGWVERGIFVNNRLFSLSDQALASIDYSNPSAPRVVNELTLARNVINAQPQGTTIAELSSDWWGNDTTTSEMRVLPISNAAESTDDGHATSLSIPGVGAQVFQNANLSYVVTSVQTPGPCNPWGNSAGGVDGPTPVGGTGGKTGCTVWTQQVQVVDTSNGNAVIRGTVTLPPLPNGWGGWGWEGFWYYDWFDGADVVQVGGNALAFRRWFPYYAPTANGGYQYVDSLDALYVVDLSNPDAPSLASTSVTTDPDTWWGNMRAVGNTLYTTHYEWMQKPSANDPSGTAYTVRYYLDQIDLSDRSHPKVGAKINVPGVLVGASTSDPSILYTIDYRWSDSGNNPFNEFDAVKIDGNLAYLQSQTQIDGWVGNVIVQNDKAYMSAEQYQWAVVNSNGTYTPPFVDLHQLDLTKPAAPVDRISTDKANGWGWLLSVQGDRAVVTSGWGPVGIDIYKLSDTAAPAFDQSVRTLGWGVNGITRQDNTLYLSSGYWGVQPVTLQ